MYKLHVKQIAAYNINSSHFIILFDEIYNVVSVREDDGHVLITTFDSNNNYFTWKISHIEI